MDLAKVILITCFIASINTCNAIKEIVPEDFLISVLNELSLLKNQFSNSEKFYEQKLATVEKKLHETEDVRKYYQQKVAEVENLLQKAEDTGNFYEQKLAYVEKKLYQTEERLSDAEKFIDKLNSVKSEPKNIADKNDMTHTHKSNEIFTKDLSGKTAIRPGNLNVYHNGSSTKYIQEESQAPHKLRNTATTSNVQIAFSSYLSSHAYHLQPEQTIPFDEILINQGQGFDTSTSKFTCPVSGVYVFQSSVMAQRYDYVQTEIVKNGYVVVRMYAATDKSTTRFDQGFNSGITECYKGEKVWVRIVEHWGTQVRSSRFTTFSGYLLWPM
ncbi:caprin-2-like [Mercenaria mercenaria]|uniref:caprin-2-like n=1 Tax=Mercenaria mercenaria TaxID=6596 RepID=UPI00234EBB4A|nr:caprin-2-like [Mercenaria mercenaria]